MTGKASKLLAPPEEVPVSQSGSRSKHPAPLLVPATEEDIPTLAQITVSATLTDLFTIVSEGSPAKYQEFIAAFIKKVFSLPSWRFVKALDPENQNRIIGWGATDVRGTDWADQAKPPDQKGLNGIRAKRFYEVQMKWFAEKRFLYLMAIFVEPTYQGGGVGSGIMAWAEERADEEGLAAFLQNMAGAAGFYEARGWHEVGNIEVDLSEWAKEKAREKGGGLGYGVYRTGFRIKLPSERRKEDLDTMEQSYA